MPSVRQIVAAAVAVIPHLAAGLQVAPGSPCSGFCIDSPSLDESDPDSSNTGSGDIVCTDEGYTSQENGRKFQRCLTCLQSSAHTADQESDQQWFFYNLRYAIDYCVMGYPNGTDTNGGGPCTTSESCGAFEEALEFGIEDPAYAQPYQFCGKSDGRLASAEYMDNCQACVGVDDSQSYLVNFLVAVRAGCEQKPANNMLVGLSDSVFATSTISIVQASSSINSSSSSSNQSSLSSPAIVGIVIGSLVVILFTSGCIFMQLRKRQNRRRIRLRLRRQQQHNPMSPMSFRCQTPSSAHHHDDDGGDDGEKGKRTAIVSSYVVSPAEALRSNPFSFRKLPGITTAALPTPPSPIRDVSTAASSPENHFVTPTTTTSTHSNAHLLSSTYRPYNPADFSPSIPGLAITTSHAETYHDTPTSTPSSQINASVWEQPDPHSSGDDRGANPRRNTSSAWGFARNKTSPSTATRNAVQLSFPPPPGSGK
ncbi:hypothetical protein GMORB2_4594 [Geosmithia morbida]|uniref:LPXTG-domain-containing protein n=1 Tax=Geosmithia morbida TaxID=1094350 RepID=A0A9P4YN77_9HYPO|nr:uncharacterized protein GMORB2_4594 [Geosmithia morbida]KAF4119685.1 hypothetical protein GMORB2_4594 [Geosmithia morbida]